ncbi:MFS transporter [Ferdinandcohnia quinoae]|uniref:MFS transporter n=1 Tax=Fredinandcohnia quinoae TaxID=2918902 RepID=A0AAW5E4W6_9BACI|nr:MFS transporter [Fredinandcohnia sp. SECRCQ15]MCH1627388.1 MFS transporter [Fredinandcohnia sp. SECRCQ15]
MSSSFYHLLLSQSTTKLAYSLYTMTIITFLYQETGSATLASAVTIISMVSQLMSSSTVPLMMEKFPLRRILLLSQISQLTMYVLIVVSLLMIPSPLNYFLLLIFLSLISFFNGWSNPSRSALIPEIVLKEKLVSANSILSTTDQTLLLFGWSIGGILIAYFGHGKVILITIALLILSIISLFLLKTNATTIKKKRKSRIETLKEGWIIVFKHPTLRTITKMDIIELFGGGIWIGAVTLVYVQEALGQDEKWWGYINSTYYAGSIIGGILVWRFSKTINKSLIGYIVIGSIGVSILTIIYSFVSTPLVALILVVLMGPLYQVRDIAQSTFIQNTIDKETLGKYLASKATINQAVFSLSVFIIGMLVDLISARFVYLFSGFLLLCSGIYAYQKLFKKQQIEVKHNQNL